MNDTQSNLAVIISIFYIFITFKIFNTENNELLIKEEYILKFWKKELFWKRKIKVKIKFEKIPHWNDSLNISTRKKLNVENILIIWIILN